MPGDEQKTDYLDGLAGAITDTGDQGPDDSELAGGSSSRDDEATDQEQDNILRDILRKNRGEEGEDPKPKRTRNDKGQFVAAGDDEDEAEGEEGKKSSRSDGADPDAISDALKVLQRAKVPKKIVEHALESMDPEDFLQWAEDERQRQRERDQLGNQLDLARKGQVKEDQGGEPDGDTQASDKGGAGQGEADPGIDLDALVQPFAQEYGDELAQPLKAFGEGIVEAVLDRVQAERQQDRMAIAQLQQLILHREVTDARTRLSEDFPELEDEQTWKQVETRMEKIASSGDFDNAIDLVRSACLIEFGAGRIQDLQKRLKKSHRQRSSGQPTSRTKSAPKSELSHDERETEAIRHIIRGDREAAFALAGTR